VASPAHRAGCKRELRSRPALRWAPQRGANRARGSRWRRRRQRRGWGGV